MMTVATALPEKLVTALASDMNRSMPHDEPDTVDEVGRCDCSPPAIAWVAQEPGGLQPAEGP
jgi:hypothetical protein